MSDALPSSSPQAPLEPSDLHPTAGSPEIVDPGALQAFDAELTANFVRAVAEKTDSDALGPPEPERLSKDGSRIGLRKPPKKICTVCVHPDLQNINVWLARGDSLRSVLRKASSPTLSLGAVARHHKNHLANSMRNNGSPDRPNVTLKSITVRRAERVSVAALRNLKKIMSGGDPDGTKAANGALTAAVRAIEFNAEAIGELQRGANVNVQVSVEAKAAVDMRSAAEAMTTRDVLEEAGAYLRAHLEAGDEDAMRIVASLMRSLPSADAQERSSAEPDAAQ